MKHTCFKGFPSNIQGQMFISLNECEELETRVMVTIILKLMSASSLRHALKDFHETLNKCLPKQENMH